MVRLILLRILESYFRHRWLYLMPVVLLSIFGAAYLLLRDPQYVAEGVVFVKQESFIAQLTSIRDVSVSWNTPAQDIATEFTDLMQTDAFVRAIIAKTDLEDKMDEGSTVVNETLDDVRKSVWAGPQGRNQVLVSAAYEDPLIVVQLVNAAIDNFFDWSINTDRVESETALTFFLDLSATYKTDLEATREALINYSLAHPEPLRGARPEDERLEIDRLQSELEVAGTRYARALDNVESARLALTQLESNANQTYIIIDSPVVPDKPEVSRKSLATELIIFIVIGIMLSVVGIGGSTLLNRSFMFPVDVVNLTGLPVLASIPYIKPPRGKKQRESKKLMNSKAAEKSVPPAEITPSPNGSADVGEPERTIS